MGHLSPRPAPVRHTPDETSHLSRPAADPSGIPCIQVTRYRNYNVGSAIRHLWHVGLRDGANLTVTEQMRNLKDAKYYIEDELERLQQINAREEANHG